MGVPNREAVGEDWLEPTGVDRSGWHGEDNNPVLDAGQLAPSLGYERKGKHAAGEHSGNGNQIYQIVPPGCSCHVNSPGCPGDILITPESTAAHQNS